MPKPTVNYDQAADTLYITFQDVPAEFAEEDEIGIVKRYLADRTLIGITMLDFTERLLEENAFLNR